MSDKGKKLWNEVIDGIDEKYIDKTAETLAKNNAYEGKLTEIIVEKPQADKNRKLKHAVAITLTAAASLGIIIGAGHLLKKYDIKEENPSQTTASVTQITTPDITQNTAPLVTEEDDVEIIITKFTDYSVQLSLNNDGSPLTLDIFVDGVNTCQYVTDIPPVEIGALKPSLKNARLKDGDIIEVIVPKLGEDNTGIEYTIHLFSSTKDTITPLLHETGERFSFISEYDYCTEDIETNSVQTEPGYGKERPTYMIDFRSGYVTETFMYPVDNNLNYVNFSKLDLSVKYSEDDNPFIGRWIRAYGGTDNEYYPITISGNGLIAETEEGIFIYDGSSGYPYYYFICNGYPDYIFRYFRLDDNTLTFSNYERVYKRADSDDAYRNYLTADYTDFDVRLTYDAYTDITCVRLETIYMNDVLFTKELGMTFESVNQQTPSLAYEEYPGGKLLILTVPIPSESTMGRYKTYLYSCTKDSIEEIEILDISGNPTEIIPTDYVHFYNTAEPVIAFTVPGDIRNRYVIDFSTLTAKESHLYSIDGNSEDIDLNIDYERSARPELFEELFYGKWSVVFSENYSINPTGEILNLTYNGDSAFYQWASFRTVPYETDDAYIMTGINGGEPQLICIYKNDPEHLYYYQYPLLQAKKNDYDCVYERIEADYVKEIRLGELTNYGINKIYNDTGFDITETPDTVTDDEGKIWKKWYNLGHLGTGQTYIQHLSENEIRYALLYGPLDAETVSYNSYENIPDVRYLNFTAVRTNGEWEITNIEGFDRELEEQNTADTALKQSVIEMKSGMGMESGYVKNGVTQEIIYYPRTDGTYYAFRKVSDDGGVTCHSEFYYYSGVSWLYLGGCEGESYPAIKDDLFYYAIDFEFAEDYERPDTKEWKTIIYVWDKNTIKNAYWPEYVKGVNFVEVYKTGDYNIIHLRNQLEREQIFLHTNTILSTSIEEAEAIVYDEDGKGFTVQIDFTDYIYRPDSEKLYDNIWHLFNSAETVWEATMNGSHHITQGVDYTKTIIASDGTELGYYCEYWELYNVLCGIYTEECVKEIFEQSNVDLTEAGGSVYANGKFSREPYIGDIEWGILYETESEAEILCILYPYDHKNQKQSETPCGAYLVSAVKNEATGNEWRLDDFKLEDVVYNTENVVNDKETLRALIFLTELEPSVMKAVGDIVLNHISDEDFWNNDNTYLHPTKEAVQKFEIEALNNPELLLDKDLVYYECQNGYWNGFDFE